MSIDVIFKIAAIGIIVSILNQVLSRSGREEQATIIRNNRLADELPALGTDRQVLEIRIGRREATSSRNRLVISGMYLTRLRIDISG